MFRVSKLVYLFHLFRGFTTYLYRPLGIRLYVQIERDYPYIPIQFGWDWNHQSSLIGRDQRILREG